VSSRDRIALFLNALPMGGAERNVLELSRFLSRSGHPVDLVLAEHRGELLREIPSGVRVVDLEKRSRLETLAVLSSLPLASFPDLAHLLFRNRLLTSLVPLRDYLQRERPRALLTTITKNALLALWARHLSGRELRVVVREANVFSRQHSSKAGRDNPILTRLARRWYPCADVFVAVCHAVGDDLVDSVGVSRERIVTVHNPVDADRLAAAAREPLEHPWLRAGEPPVLLSVGRLTEQKDFPTLLRAFAILRRERPARLLVLGEGRCRPQLEALCRELRIEDDVSFPGVVRNPQAFMARSAVFVLSSAWEGFVNVLLEALACGCAVVSTDCTGGSAEILAGGRFGHLVGPGDPIGLAKSVGEALDHPADRELLRGRALEFPPEAAFGRYRDVLLGG